MLRYISIVLFSLILSVYLPDIIKHLFPSSRLIKGPTPASIGGITIWLVFIVAAFVFLGTGIFVQPYLLGLLLSGSVLLIFGIIDDLKELSIAAKFFAQFVAIGVLLLFGIKLRIPQLGQSLNLIITILWVLGINNALNHLDVADGIAVSVAVTCFLAFFILATFSNQIGLSALCLILTAAALGFLKHNLPPAKIYLGNAGSHLLGFMLAAIALSINYSSFSSRIALLSPLIILGLPILDTVYLSFVRLKKGVSPMSKSDDHIALQMRARGFSRYYILFLTISLNVFFCIAGVILAHRLT